MAFLYSFRFSFDLVLLLIDTNWIDVCQTNGNLLVADNYHDIKIIDKREAKIIKTFDAIHKGKILLCFLIRLILIFSLIFFFSCSICNRFWLDLINCVRWDPSGDLLSSASFDRTTKVLDFKTGKILYSGISPDESKFILSNSN